MKEKEIYRQITRYIKGKLSPEEIDELWVEFLQNPELFEDFETELHLADLFINKGYSLDTVHVNEPIIKKYRTWIYAAAAAVLLAVGLQFFSAGETTVTEYAVSEIDATELMGADVYRSDEDDTNRVDIQINTAIAMALKDERIESINRFEGLLDEELERTQTVYIHTNLGILWYNEGDFEKSIYHFNNTLTIEDLPHYLEEKAWWFLGNAHLNQNNLGEARDAVFNAYTMDGRFQSPALALLKKLDKDLKSKSDISQSQ